MTRTKRTNWYPPGTHPARKGYYERKYTDGIYLHYWDGKVWRFSPGGSIHWRQVHAYPVWRGLTKEPINVSHCTMPRDWVVDVRCCLSGCQLKNQ